MEKISILLVSLFYLSLLSNELTDWTCAGDFRLEYNMNFTVTEDDCRDDVNVTYYEVTFLWFGVIPKKMILSSCESGGDFKCPLDACNSETETSED